MKYVLYFYISTFRSMCVVPNMAVFVAPLLLLLLSLLRKKYVLVLFYAFYIKFNFILHTYG